jgi:hypothetical protein
METKGKKQTPPPKPQTEEANSEKKEKRVFLKRGEAGVKLKEARESKREGSGGPAASGREGDGPSSFPRKVEHHCNTTVTPL